MRTLLLENIHYHRSQADQYRVQAIDLMSWKQFQVFHRTGVVKSKSRKLLSALEREKEHREYLKAAKERLHRLESIEVLEGGRNPLFPSSPIGQLALAGAQCC
jgi:hypothetical protein